VGVFVASSLISRNAIATGPMSRGGRRNTHDASVPRFKPVKLAEISARARDGFGALGARRCSYRGKFSEPCQDAFGGKSNMPFFKEHRWNQVRPKLRRIARTLKRVRARDPHWGKIVQRKMP
jgi:hypothetical protein